jgi:hypothetical protein
VLAIVGPDWCSEQLRQSDDLLRRELEIALAKRRTVVLAVLVHGARYLHCTLADARNKNENPVTRGILEPFSVSAICLHPG